MTSVDFVIGDIGQIGQLLHGYPSGQTIAVVNATNSEIHTGGGVTGALVRAVGGGSMWNHLRQSATRVDQSLFMDDPHLKLGESVWTLTDGQLLYDNVDYMIHGLGPVAGIHDISEINQTIVNVLNLATQLKVETLILPAISGGIFAIGHPTWAKEIRQLILDTIDTYLANTHTTLKQIYLVSYDENDQNLWLP